MYVLGDPINGNDPRGLDTCDGSIDDSNDDTYGCVDYSASVGSDSCSQIAMGLTATPDPSCFYAAGTQPVETVSAGDVPCNAANGITADQTVAVETVMGENSNYWLGKTPYPNAPTVTAASVYQEDVDMFSVLTNRAQATGSTIGGVILANPQRFSGYSTSKNGGITQYNAALTSAQGSSPCDDLTAIVSAMNYVSQNGSQLASSYLYWKSINQGNGIYHVPQPGDIDVANTAFGTVNTH
jgi:hypothetical protein